MVETEGDPLSRDDRPTVNDSFRAAIVYNINATDSSANECDIVERHADQISGFVDEIGFATEFVLGEGDPDAVATVTLVATDAGLDIQPQRDVKIGNSSLAMLADRLGTFPDEISDLAYINQYTNVSPQVELPASDRVVIDGRAAHLKCSGITSGSGLKGYAYLSDVIVLAADGERMGQGCWRNAGAGYLCDGTLKSGKDPADFGDPDGTDYTQWCDSATVPDSGTGDDDDDQHEFDFTMKWECIESQTKWRDQDADNYGDASEPYRVCTLWQNTETGSQRAGFSNYTVIGDGNNGLQIVRLADNDDDCDDNNAQIHPDQAELCDGLDNNCSDSVDETFADLGTACHEGLGACVSEGAFICNEDGSGTVCNAVPGESADETCNEIDDDCDGSIDEEGVCDPTAPATETLCDDFNSDGSENDNDADGLANCADSDCVNDGACASESTCPLNDDGSPDCYDTSCFAETVCAAVVDEDQDNDGVTIRNGDCNDEPNDTKAAAISPEEDEICLDQIDNDCDGNIDDATTCVNPNENETTSNGGCGCDLKAKRPAFAQYWLLLGVASLQVVNLFWLRQKKRV